MHSERIASLFVVNYGEDSLPLASYAIYYVSGPFMSKIIGQQIALKHHTIFCPLPLQPFLWDTFSIQFIAFKNDFSVQLGSHVIEISFLLSLLNW